MRTLAIASGKGGVGKSTVALNLAVAMARTGRRVGLADLDLYGPDLPAMVGLTRRRPAKAVDVWKRPDDGRKDAAIERFGIRLMSTQFLIGESQSLALSASMAELLVHRMVEGIDWGPLDVLILDLPPGTADVQRIVAQRLHPDGAVLVVTPQDVAHLDAKKVVTMFENAGIEVVGAIENMAGLVCPCCDNVIDLFPGVAPERSLWAEGVERLASLRALPAVAAAAEEGEPWVLRSPDSDHALEFARLAERLG